MIDVSEEYLRKIKFLDSVLSSLPIEYFKDHLEADALLSRLSKDSGVTPFLMDLYEDNLKQSKQIARLRNDMRELIQQISLPKKNQDLSSLKERYGID